MNRSEYKQLKKKVEEQYKQAIDLAEKQRIDRLAALDTVWKMLHVPRHKRGKGIVSQQSESAINSAGEGNKPFPKPSYGSLVTEVKKSLALVPAEFTCRNVITIMTQTSGTVFNYSSVSNRLKRLAKEGAIEVIRQGHGKSPSIYRLENAHSPMDVKT